jgi:hypothetical protein
MSNRKSFLVLLTLGFAALALPPAHADDTYIFTGFQPSNADGGSWAVDVNCVVDSGSLTISTDLTTITKKAKYFCTLHDSVNGDIGPVPCTGEATYSGLTPTCDPDNHNKLIITGLCPDKKNPVVQLSASMDCSAATNGYGTENSPICNYVGDDPSGDDRANTTCVWNWGLKDNGKTLTGKQCTDWLGDPAVVMSYENTYRDELDCTSPETIADTVADNPPDGIGTPTYKFLHSHRWDPAYSSIYDIDNGAGKAVAAFTADYSITNKTTVNSVCKGPPNSNDNLQVTVWGNPMDPAALANQLDASEIKEAFINGRPCTDATADETNNTYSCLVARCDENGVNIVQEIFPSPDGPYTVLELSGAMNDETEFFGEEKLFVSDNEAVQVSATNVTVPEGDSGTTDAVVTLTATSQVNLNWNTVDDTATDGSDPSEDTDYVASSGTITVPGDGSGTTVTIPINGDTQYEDDERFFVVFSGGADVTAVVTIQSDDTSEGSASDVEVTEGDRAVVTFSLTQPVPGLTLHAELVFDGTADLNDVYPLSVANVTFTGTETEKTWTVDTVADDGRSKPFAQTLHLVITGNFGDFPGVTCTACEPLITIDDGDASGKPVE